MKFTIYFLILCLTYSQGEAQRQCYVCENCRTMPQGIERTTCSTLLTTTTIETTTTTTPQPIPPAPGSADENNEYISKYKMNSEPILVRQRRQEDPWQCYEIEVRVGDADIHNRGCVQRTASNEITCQSANDGPSPQYCRLCDSDGCNSASVATISVALLISSFVLASKNT